MCRLLGYASPWTATTEDVIGAGRCTAFQQMGRLHADGWGTAWIDEDGGVARHRDPRSGSTNPELTQMLAAAPSTARISHLRLATQGFAVADANTHPFQVGPIALAHNGSIKPFDRLRPLVSDHELQRIGADTDTACVFALILRELDGGAELFEAVRSVAGRIALDFPGSALNLLVLSSRELIAVHSNEGAPIPHEDFARSGLGDALPLDHLDHYYRMSWVRQLDGTVAFSSSGLDRDGWDALPQHTAARVELGSQDFALEPIG